LFSRETYAVILLQRKTKRLQKQTGNPQLRSKMDRGISRREVLARAIVRPTKMTLFSPINIILSASSAFVYGVLYLLLTTFPMVFGNVYGFSTGISGLTYLGLGVGNILGLLCFTFTSDRYVRARLAKGEARPEDRLPLLLLSGPLLAAGLFWYGWSAQAHTHWIVPIIGAGLEGMGNMMFFMPITGYLVDAFNEYAASALAANTVLRSIGGALLPLAGPSMYQALGYGWGNSLLAFLTIAFTPALFFIYRYGETLRLKYPLNL
jgi:MFS family permease